MSLLLTPWTRFTQAEYSGYFGDLGCATTADTSAMKAKTEAFTQDVLDEICPPAP